MIEEHITRIMGKIFHTLPRSKEYALNSRSSASIRPGIFQEAPIRTALP